MEGVVRKGDLDQVKALIRSGVQVSGELRDKGSGSMLMVAIQKGYKDITLELLAAGADVQARDGRQQTALHWACYKGWEEVVQVLISRGSRLDERDWLGRTPVVVANREFQCDSDAYDQEVCHMSPSFSNVAILMCLLRAGASCEGLSEGQMNDLLHHACHVADILTVRALLEKGCNVNILPREDREELLRHASHEGNIFVAHAVLKNGNGCSVSILPQEQQEILLHRACRLGDVSVVEALLSSGCNVSCAYNGDFPLMVAAHEGHEEIVKKLILSGANIGMQSTHHGDTALHMAARRNHIQSGILLAEGGASAKTRNSLSESPLDLASQEFKEAIKEAQSFTTRKILCIIGNAEGGKSTLIAALQAERNTFLGKIVNRFRRVDDNLKRTAGIETIPHCSQRYGEVLFYDFAGQHEYHGPHQMFLEALLCKPGVSVTLLLVVKATRQEEAILHQLHRWLSPVALLATTASPPQVIIVGSFLDKVKSEINANAKLTRCIEATKEDLEALPLQFVGLSLLNCRQPQSRGIDQLCRFLQDVPIPEFRATHTQYSLAWVLSQIRLSFKARAVQLQEFSSWIQDNKSNLPQTMPPPEEVCQDLSAAGHALYLSNKEDPTKSWLVLDLPSILHDVYGTLFSRSKGIVNEFGLLHCQDLARLFPDLDLEIVQQLLSSLEFCIPVDPSVLKVEVCNLTQSEDTTGWLFFPALISAKRPQLTFDNLPQQSVHCFYWQLWTASKHSISARILQTVLLHLAAHFVVKHHLMEGVQQHCCSIWWNGITWQSKKGVDVAVHISNNRVIQVVGASITAADRSCQYLADVINNILLTVRQLSPQLAATAYILHPPKMPALCEVLPNQHPEELFPVEDIRNSIRDGEMYSLSLKDSDNHSTRIPISSLFGGFTPSLVDIESFIWTVPESNSSLYPNELNQTPAPTELGQSQSPPTLNQTPPAELGQTQSPTGSNQTPPPTELGQTQSPAGSNQAPPPTELGQTKSTCTLGQTQPPTGSNQNPSPVELGQSQSPPGSSQLQTRAPSPTKLGQTQSLTGSNQTPAPTELSQTSSQSPPGLNQTHPPAELGQTQSPPGSKQTPAPSELGQIQPRTDTNQTDLMPTVLFQAPSLVTEPYQIQSSADLKQTQIPIELSEPRNSLLLTEVLPSTFNPPPIPTSASTDSSTHVAATTNTPPIPTASNALYRSGPPMQGAQALLDISSKPHPRDISELFSKQVAANWRDLALRLGVELYICENISKDHPTDCEEACWKMLNRWLKGEHDTGKRERTWWTLLTAAHQVGHSQLVDNLKRVHFKPSAR